VERIFRYPLDRRLGSPCSKAGCFRREKHLLHMPGIESKILGCPGCSIVTVLTVLPRLLLVSVKYCYFKDRQSICHMGEKNSACRVLAGKRRGKRPFGIPCALMVG
jgi:hypothetical protein